MLKVASECPNKGRNRIEKDEIIVEKKTLTKRKFTNTENRNLKLEEHYELNQKAGISGVPKG